MDSDVTVISSLPNKIICKVDSESGSAIMIIHARVFFFFFEFEVYSPLFTQQEIAVL